MIKIKEFLTFSAIGAIATTAHYTLMLLLIELSQLEPTTATTSGFALGALISYSLNYRITFRSTQPHKKAAPKFLVAATSGMLLNAAIVSFGVYIASIYYMTAQIISTLIVLFWNYLINKYWTF